MGNVIDLTGKKFGRLRVLNELPERKNRAVYWLCVCDCGKKTKVSGNHLKTGHTRSCGCLYDPEMNTKHGYNRRDKVRPEYRIWNNMKYRCNNKNYREYYLYGGRGISVCESWNNSFEAFLKDMGDRPSKKHSIDRVDPNGNYEPSNCRWATVSEQQKNRRSNRWIEYGGKKMILADWGRLFKASPSNIITMLKKKSFSEIATYYLSR